MNSDREEWNNINPMDVPIVDIERVMKKIEGTAEYEIVTDDPMGRSLVRTVATGQWIDAKAMKPKVGETALFGGRYDTSVGVWRGVVDINDELIVDTAMGACALSATHWMPIPELPESP